MKTPNSVSARTDAINFLNETAEPKTPRRELLAPEYDFSKTWAHTAPEFLKNKGQKFSLPLSDILTSPDAAAELWPDFADKLVPELERHSEISSKVDAYIDNYFYGRGDEEELDAQREEYYAGVSELLSNPETERIALFLPFETYPDKEDQSPAAEQFRANFISAWQNLLFVQDVRANFTDGGDPTARVVKAAHLTPWLVQKGMVTMDDVMSLISHEKDPVLLQSFAETLPLLRQFNVITPDQQMEFPLPATPARPAITPERPSEPTDDLYTLGLSAAARVPSLSSKILASEKIAEKLDSTETIGVILLNGDRLKGYGQPDDPLSLKIITRNKTATVPEDYDLPLDNFYSDPSSEASNAFSALAIGNADDVQGYQRELGQIYFTEQNPSLRRWATEKLEQDLLEYSLLHSGYPRLCPNTNPDTAPESFYETGYRCIATKIFARSVYIPKA